MQGGEEMRRWRGILEKLSEFMKRDYNLKTTITEECCELKKIEVICFTANTSFPLLTLTYNKCTKHFVLAIERRFVTQKSTLQALIEALEKVKEVMQSGEMERIER